MPQEAVMEERIATGVQNRHPGHRPDDRGRPTVQMPRVEDPGKSVYFDPSITNPRNDNRPLWRVIADFFKNRRNPGVNTGQSTAQGRTTHRLRWSSIVMIIVIVLMAIQRWTDIAATKAAFDQVHKQTGAKIQYDPSFMPFGVPSWLNPFNWSLTGFLVVVVIAMAIGMFFMWKNSRQSNQHQAH